MCFVTVHRISASKHREMLFDHGGRAGSGAGSSGWPVDIPTRTLIPFRRNETRASPARRNAETDLPLSGPVKVVGIRCQRLTP